MTILSVKRDLQTLFNISTSNSVSIAELLDLICKQASMHFRVETLAKEVKALAEKGPFHTSETEDASGRYGNSLEPKMIDELQSKADLILTKLTSHSQETMGMEDYEASIAVLKTAVEKAYPFGLPETDPINRLFEHAETELDSKDFELWWAGKQLKPEKCVSDYCGRNEKTKLVVKLQRKGSGPPTKENPLDEQGQKNLMAYYFRKQEEEKRLALDKDLDFMRAPWADSQKLKRDFNGLCDVGVKPR